MKTQSIIVMMCLALIVASCDSKKLKEENAALQTELNDRTAELDEMMALFNEINENFRQISAVENRVDLQRGKIAEGSKTARQQFASDIEFIRNQMEEQKNQIENLQNMLKTSKNKSSQLQKAVDDLTQELVAKIQRIEELEAELAAKNIRITELSDAVSSLEADKAALTSTNASQAQTVAEQDKALHTAWYVYGTKKELKEQNILDGSDVLTQADVNMSYFTEIDIRQTTEIEIYAKKPQLLTNHPSASYTLEELNKQEFKLKILDPTTFWSVSKYLVIQVR